MRFVLGCFFVVAAGVAAPQSSQEFHNCYGESVEGRFKVRPGISLTVQYGSDHLACEFVVEPSKRLVPLDPIGSLSTMPSGTVTEILEEIVPFRMRGNQVSIGEITYGCADVNEIFEYDNVLIMRSVFGCRGSKAEQQENRVTVALRRDICPKPKISAITTSTKRPSMLVGVEALAPLEGVDFSAYLTHLDLVVKRNWYALMPESALMGSRGRVVARIQIQKDGTLLTQTPSVEVSSGEESLDRAAVGAIGSSAPFEQLPEAFHGPSIEIRLTFFYNYLPAPNLYRSL
jgi:TonB family protein